jgi:hypothetical protein
MIYDLFYVSVGRAEHWQEFKDRFPSAQLIENIQSLDDIKKRTFTRMFWVVWDDMKIREDFDFEYRATEWDLDYVHVFKNGNHFNGVILMPKNSPASNKEFKYRFFINKKEIDIVASDPRKVGSSFDIVFISYNEPHADANWQKLKSRFPRAKRISNVKGIHEAHMAAARIVDSEMFWVVDGDAQIVDDFNFDYEDPELYTVHVWRSINPINDLVYGYGGVKLLPTQMTLDMDLSKPDMTTSISNKFRVVEQISNVTAFNTGPFDAWKSAFRECCKLASKTIRGQNDAETEQRLDVWCSDVGKQREFGEHAIRGAKEGREYGKQNSNDTEALYKINDFNWLMERFNEG